MMTNYISEGQTQPTSLDELQETVQSCRSVAEHIVFHEIAQDLGMLSSIVGDNLGSDINRFVENCVKASKMVAFLEKLRKRENIAAGAYSTPFWNVIEKWYYYQKSESEWTEFISWLDSFYDELNDSQKQRLDSYRRRDQATNGRPKVNQIRYPSGVYLFIAFNFENEVPIVDMGALSNGRWIEPPDKKSSTRFSRANLAELEQVLISDTTNYVEKIFGSIYDTPSRYDLIISTQYMYKFSPEKWPAYKDRGHKLGESSKVVFRCYENFFKSEAARESYELLRKNYVERKSMAWIFSWNNETEELWKKTDEFNSFMCHKIPDSTDKIDALLREYPYALATRQDFDLNTDACICLHDMFDNLENDLPGQVLKLRKSNFQDSNHPINSLFIIWDDGSYRNEIAEVIGRQVYLKGKAGENSNVKQ